MPLLDGSSLLTLGPPESSPEQEMLVTQLIKTIQNLEEILSDTGLHRLLTHS
jgi:hypothetical protein